MLQQTKYPFERYLGGVIKDEAGHVPNGGHRHRVLDLLGEVVEDEGTPLISASPRTWSGGWL